MSFCITNTTAYAVATQGNMWVGVNTQVTDEVTTDISRPSQITSLTFPPVMLCDAKLHHMTCHHYHVNLAVLFDRFINKGDGHYSLYDFTV